LGVDADEVADALRPIYPDLRRFAAVVGPLDVDPDDLVQEAVVRLLVSGQWQKVRDLRAYLRRTIVNLASNERRRFARQQAAVELNVVEITLVAAYPSDLAELGRVEPMTRALLYLVELEDYPIDEAAALVGCTPAAARTRLSRARRRLKSELETGALDD
jgi:RNA polymerase sigma-70 factor (ECF subfamily)